MNVLSKLTGGRIHTSKSSADSSTRESGSRGPRESFTPSLESDADLIKPGMAGRPRKSDRVDKMLDTISSPEGTFTMAVGAILLSAAAALLRRND